MSFPCCSLGLARPVNRRSCLRYAVCKAMRILLTQYCRMLLYLGHLLRQCNWAGETANTGVFASEGLQIVMCLLDRLNMGDTLLKHERTVATALLCHTAWHTAMPGQAFAKEFCESLLSSLVTKKGQTAELKLPGQFVCSLIVVSMLFVARGLGHNVVIFRTKVINCGRIS